MHSMRSPSCGHSVRRHIRTASEGIWVTDTVLARAFERYCAASPAVRRHVSFAPGPLESRRRLGRRHMTELYSFQAHASLPPWALEMPADLGQWQWRPPTLRNNPIDGSIMEQPEENASQPWLPNLLDPLSPHAETCVPTDVEADGLSPAEDDVERDVQWLMEQIMSKDSKNIKPSIDIFIDSLKAHARNENLVPGHIYQISITLPALLAANGANKGPPAGLASLLDAICEVTGLVKAAGRSEFDSSFWNLFLNQLLLLKGQLAACDIFAKFMNLIPSQHFGQVRDAVEAILVSVSKHLCRTRDSTSASPSSLDAPTAPYEIPKLWPLTITDIPFQRYAIPIVQGLNRFETENHPTHLRALIDGASRSGNKRIQHKLCVFWLSVLARMPLVRQELLFQMIRQFCLVRSGGKRLSDAEATQLLLLHWTSRGYLKRPGELLQSPMPHGQSSALAQLAVAICSNTPKSRHVGFLTSLSKCLTRTGRTGSLVDSFEALCLGSSTLLVRPFALLAVVCDDYTSVMKLRRLTQVHARKFGKGAKLFARAWDWRLWATKTKELSNDLSVDALELRALLSVDTNWQPRRKNDLLPKRRNMLGDLSIRTVSRLEGSARDIVTHLATNAPPDRQLTRMALHLVTTRIRYLRAHGVILTAPLLKILTRLLILDLQNGQPGRTTRLKWLLGLIAESQGHEAAEAAGRQLAQWRKRNARLAQASPKKEDAAEAALRLLDEPFDSEPPHSE